jgi:hypothetical protein
MVLNDSELKSALENLGVAQLKQSLWDASEFADDRCFELQNQEIEMMREGKWF